ncbi:hypothetical protein EIP75_22370 [Aquabacterium soli]|uniref:Uncharacterized protein n=1 Tax=Aquabacterium soli TaxID=2493092 RepID=A0A3R8T8J1_9BURK|nr:hypothetical protein [Aquabacterium soli]RRS01002.1 hypothetical protein EIP75_22370 [Aquabacterium soli]
MTPRALQAAQILWPAFLVAGLIEMVVFAWVDPTALQLSEAWQPSPMATYTMAFLTFWAMVAAASAVSLWLMQAPAGQAPKRISSARY